MGDWWIYPMVGVGIAFIAWIFGAGQEEGIDRAREALASHEPADAARLGRADRFHP